MNIVYLGSGRFGIECLNALAGSNHNIEFICTAPAGLAGRGRKPLPTAVAQWAQDNKIPYIETADVNSPEIIDQIANLKPQLIVVIACGQKIGNQLINLPPKGAINVHASLLPKYRGAAPINWAIINGETETGISIIALAEKMDAGAVCGQVKTDIGVGQTAGELHDKLASLAAPLLLKTIDRIAAGTAVYTEQDHSKATLAPKLKKSDGFIDFSEPAEILERKVRGFWPWPGASALYVSKRTSKSQRVIIAAAEVVKTLGQSTFAPGTFDQQLNVTCGQDALAIKKIKPAGCGFMDFTDFVNGRATAPGDLLVKIEE